MRLKGQARAGFSLSFCVPGPGAGPGGQGTPWWEWGGAGPRRRPGSSCAPKARVQVPRERAVNAVGGGDAPRDKAQGSDAGASPAWREIEDHEARNVTWPLNADKPFS